jgi:hypothetical protein
MVVYFYICLTENATYGNTSFGVPTDACPIYEHRRRRWISTKYTARNKSSVILSKQAFQQKDGDVDIQHALDNLPQCVGNVSKSYADIVRGTTRQSSRMTEVVRQSPVNGKMEATTMRGSYLSLLCAN